LGDVEDIFAASGDPDEEPDPLEDMDSDELLDPLEIDLENEGDEDLELGLDLEAIDEEGDELLFDDGDLAEG
jgi:hypothetical protein